MRMMEGQRRLENKSTSTEGSSAHQPAFMGLLTVWLRVHIEMDGIDVRKCVESQCKMER